MNGVGNNGLANLGNTCYMNSALQCLSHLEPFHPSYETFELCSKVEGCLMKEWFKFQQQMWSSKQGMINPMKLLQCFQRQCSEKGYVFENFNQNDADEFLTLFLDLLHQGVKRAVKIQSCREQLHPTNEGEKLFQKGFKVWKQFYEKEYSYIIQTFSSQLLVLTSCPECKYYTSNHDPIQVISVEFPRNASSLRECLLAYTQYTTLDEDNEWTCDECHTSVQPNKRTLLWKTSDILIILVKRYFKLDSPISYPDILDLKDINLNQGTTKPNQYDLQGMCIHNGSLGGGHYFAVCKNNKDSTWYEYNDTNVTPISDTKRKQYSPYIFFYQRCQ